MTGWRNENRTGEANPLAKLTNEQARNMRELRANYWSIADLAVLYGISESSTLFLIRGRTYKDAGGPIEPAGVKLPLGTSVMGHGKVLPRG
jgi:hypothetical protein